MEFKPEDQSIDTVSFETDQMAGMDVQSVNAFYNMAQQAFNEKRYRLAIVYLRKILQIDNSFVSAFKMLAKIFLVRKNYKKAAEILRQAVDSNFKDAELHYQLGYIYYLQGDKALFARECTKALVVNPSFSKAFYALALLNYESFRYDKALEELRKCLTLNDHDSDAHFLLAKIYIRLRDFTSARKHLQKVIQVNANHDEALLYLGGVALQQSDYAEAIEYYTRTGRSDRKIKQRIAKAFARLQAEITGKLAEKPKDISLLMDLASLYFSLERYSEAKSTLNKVLEIQPHNLAAKINYGLMLVYEHKYLEGIAKYQEVLKNSPANKEAQSNLDKAYTLAEDFYLANFRGQENKEYLLELYMQEEKYDKAVLVMRALQTDKYAREILNRLSRASLDSYKVYQAAVLVLLNELDQAQYLLEHIEEENKNNPAVFYFLGIIAKRKGALTEAYRYFERSKLLDYNYWFAEHELQAIRKSEIARIERILEQENRPELYLEYIDLLILTGEYKQALRVLIDCAENGLKDEQFAERRKKTIDLYELELERDLEADAPTKETYLDLGEIYVHKKRFDEAFTIFQSAFSQYPDDADIKKFYNFLIQKNTKVYESMLKTEPKTMIYYNLAVLYALSGKKTEMFKMLDKAVKKDKKLAIQARYEDAFRPYRDHDRFRLITLIEGEDKNIYRMQD